MRPTIFCLIIFLAGCFQTPDNLPDNLPDLPLDSTPDQRIPLDDPQVTVGFIKSVDSEIWGVYKKGKFFNCQKRSTITFADGTQQVFLGWGIERELVPGCRYRILHRGWDFEEAFQLDPVTGKILDGVYPPDYLPNRPEDTAIN